VAVTFEGVSDSITSFVQNTNAQWPFVNIRDWEVHSFHARQASFTEMVGFVPLIPNSRRMGQWEEYAQENKAWWAESRLTAAKMDPDSTIEQIDQLEAKVNPNATNNNRALQDKNRPGPFAPLWQLSPPPRTDAIIGYDLLTHPIMERLLFAMYESNHVAISDVIDVSFLMGQETPTTKAATDREEPLQQHPQASPRSVLFQPIYDQHNFNDENPILELPKLQGVYMGVLSWESYFSDLLPDSVEGIYCVVSNDCGQNFTFRINGRQAEYLGLGDYHEPKYEANKVTKPFDEFQQPGSNITQNDDQFQCHYTLSIYPSMTLQDDLETSRPFFFTTIVGLIFCATFIVLIVYLKVVEYRTRQVEKVAKASDKILATLYPENVKKELIEDAKAEVANKKTFVSSSHDAPKANASNLVNEFLAAGDEESIQLATTAQSVDGSASSSFVGAPRFRSKPIANLFENTTIVSRILGSSESGWDVNRSWVRTLTICSALISIVLCGPGWLHQVVVHPHSH
jgi:hypothetical protein